MALVFKTDINPDSSLSHSFGAPDKRWKLNGYVVEFLSISVSATSSTSTTVQNSNITTAHVVLNDAQLSSANISWTTSAGSITLSSTQAIPAMTLYLGVAV